MSGALIALAAQGAQNIHLTYKPQMTFWKCCHKRHTNFSIEHIQQTFSGQVRLGGKLRATLARNSDLMSRTYLVSRFHKVSDLRPRVANPVGGNADKTTAITSLGDDVHLVNNVGNLCIQEARFLVGGHEFQKTDGVCMAVYEDLSQPERRRLRRLVGDFDSDDDAIAHTAVAPNTANPTDIFTTYTPLQFYWNGSYARHRSFPIIANQYHQATIEITFRPASELIRFTYNQDPLGFRDLAANTADTASNQNARAANLWSGGTLNDAFLLIDSVFLDTRERKAFSCKCLEYLVRQTQGQSYSVGGAYTSQRFQIDFNHPMMYIIHAFQSNNAQLENDWLDFTGFTSTERRSVDAITTMHLLLNNNQLNQPLDAVWCRLAQPKDFGGYSPDLFVYTHPFALHLFDNEPAAAECGCCNPSGSINFSRIDNVHLEVVSDGTLNSNSTIHTVTNAGAVPAPPAQAVEDLGGNVHHFVWGDNHNVVKTAAGMSGLYYAT